MSYWTPDDIPDLRGRIAIVTGANRGIGLYTAAQLARHGARVIVATRGFARAESAAFDLRRANPGSVVIPMELDLADLRSVRTFAAQFRTRYGRLDLLVNNAGVGYVPHGRTADGFETTMGTNHFGHFALTGLLLSRLLAAPNARVVTVSSTAHMLPAAALDFDDLQLERGYWRSVAYARSKLANLLFANELHRRSSAAGTTLRSVAASPKLTATGFGPPEPARRQALLRRLGADAQPVSVGAAPVVYAATAPFLRGGDYVQPDRRGGQPARRDAAPAAYDVPAARRLWEISAELTGVCFDFGAADRKMSA